jgi:septum formation topological specificity factor MinE
MKPLFSPNLNDPLKVRREHIYDIQSRFIPVQRLKVLQINARNNSNITFKVLKGKFKNELLSIVRGYVNKDFSKQETIRASKQLFYDFYKKTYNLGLKSNGLGVSSSLNAFDYTFKSSPLILKSEDDWIQSTSSTELIYWVNFLNLLENEEVSLSKIEKRIEMYAKTLESHLLAGRVAGSSKYSLIYWSHSNGDSSCNVCSFLAKNSPWVKEHILITPKSGNCSCLFNCRCSLRIFKSTPDEYREVKVKNLSNHNVLKSLLNK